MLSPALHITEELKGPLAVNSIVTNKYITYSRAEMMASLALERYLQ